MYAERLILETDQSGNLKALPTLPANKQFEVIFLVLKDTVNRVQRTPHPDILGKVRIIGDIFDSAPAADWNFSL